LPIVDVVALPQDPPVDVLAVLGAVCVAVAAAAECPEMQVHATWRTLPDGHYVEGRVDAALQPASTHAPQVRIRALPRNPAMIQAMLEAAARALADSLEIDPDNVFVHFEELVPGRVLAGGRVQE
jgi:hypothetical protein